MANLSRDRLIDAGLDLIDRLGPQGLTMRALAQDLEVTPTAIYYYFEGREALLEAIVEQVASTIVEESKASGAWQDQIRALLTMMVEHAAAHPSTIAWVITEYARRPPVLRIHERILSILHSAGFLPGEAVRIKGTLLRYCTGHLMLGIAASELDWREVPREAYDTYRAVRSQVRGVDPGEMFHLGIDILLVGLASQFPHRRTAR